MKRIITLLLAALMLLSLAACSANTTETEVSAAPAAADSSAAAPADLSSADAEVDLTTLSSTVVYSEVFNMVNTPEDYVGKTVKMEGAFSVYEDEASGNVYYACVIADATACCAQGIEFVPTGDLHYPDDFPEVGSEITVTGTFGTYMEGEQLYVTLFEAEMSV